MSKAADKNDPMTVTVRIMAREYAVTCPPDEHDGLVASADYLNERMTAIRRRGKALGAERIAVMTALNLARELLALKGDPSLLKPDQESLDRLKQMSSDIDQTLDQAEETKAR
ncbi:cell division protein ZapA [Nevskia ramosa]|uniref:cell division protein ZapA n=1 Tax=Nevskia ramosa TaxID=64002 RepID=UPI0003B48529|nr:cell division protein ZapA [Nevskia ramosa]